MFRMLLWFSWIILQGITLGYCIKALQYPDAWEVHLWKAAGANMLGVIVVGFLCLRYFGDIRRLNHERRTETCSDEQEGGDQ